MRTEEQLSEIAKEVSYEWGMLRWTYEQISTRFEDEVRGDEGKPGLGVPWDSGTASNDYEGPAKLEPFLLHARNLRDFLYRDGSPHDDVLAVTVVPRYVGSRRPHRRRHGTGGKTAIERLIFPTRSLHALRD